MKNISALLLTAFATVAPLVASASAPLDFNYRVAGEEHVRPVLVFNDGEDIYIQPNPATAQDVRVVGAEAERQGPYLVIRGLAPSFTLSVKKYGIAAISYKGEVASKQEPSGAVGVSPGLPKVPAIAAASGDVKLPLIRQEEKAGDSKAALLNVPPLGGSVAKQSENGLEVAVGGGKAASSVMPPPDKAQPSIKQQAEVECKPRREEKESAFVVTFPEGQTTLSASVKDSLQQAILRDDEITVIEIAGDSSSQKKSLANSRAEAIKSFLIEKGVSDQVVSIGTRAPLIIGNELRIIRTYIYPCASEGFIVTYKNSLNVTIKGSGEVSALLKRVAEQAGISFSAEGNVRKQEISLSVIGKTLTEVLEEVGEKLGAGADVIYRGQALVLRYR